MSSHSQKPSIDELARKLVESLPAGLRSARDELEQNFRSVLRTAIGKLDLVTREEFEVQQLVLARTREKLESIAARLKEMETAPAGKPARRKSTTSKRADSDEGN